MEPDPLLKPFSFGGWGFETPPLGVAEENARLAEAEGDEALAVWWRGLMDRPEESAGHQYAACERNARKAIDLLLARAEKFDAALLPLGRLLHHLLDGLHALAANGKEPAARCLMNAMCDAVNDFGMLATTKPEIFQEWAASGFGIPGILSPSAEKTADNARLVKQLHVGENYHLAILPTGKRGRKWQFQSTANGLAARLQSYIANSKGCYELHKLQAQHAGHELPAWLEDATHLGPFSAKTSQAWAKTAWQVLAEISPNGKPGKHPAFYDPKTKICNVRKTRTEDDFSKSAKWNSRVRRQCPSIAEHDIKEALFTAFAVIAAGELPVTKPRRKGFPNK